MSSYLPFQLKKFSGIIEQLHRVIVMGGGIIGGNYNQFPFSFCPNANWENLTTLCALLTQIKFMMLEDIHIYLNYRSSGFPDSSPGFPDLSCFKSLGSLSLSLPFHSAVLPFLPPFWSAYARC